LLVDRISDLLVEKKYAKHAKKRNPLLVNKKVQFLKRIRLHLV